MGVCSSSSQSDTPGIENEEANKIAAQQRRKLSVAPQHVGDISGSGGNVNQAPGNDSTENGGGQAVLETNKEARKNLNHASVSRKGLVPYSRKKVNQDRAVVKYALRGDVGLNLFGVMDGHGEFGHLVSSFVQENLPASLEAHPIRENPEEAIFQGVKNVVNQLARTDINVAFSGTTCVFGVMVDQRIYCANIGDSRGVVLREEAGGKITAIPISFDQKPENPKEKARILKAGGRVQPLPGPPNEDCGPHRVWLGEVDVPGLAMSRSIGDEVSRTVGVISVPEIIGHDLKPEDRLAVWASDGVWEFLSNEEAIEIIWRHKDDLKAAALALVDESQKRWEAEEEVIDDITCVIVAFMAP